MIGFRNLRELSKLGDADFYAVMFEKRENISMAGFDNIRMIDRSS